MVFEENPSDLYRNRRSRSNRQKNRRNSRREYMRKKILTALLLILVIMTLLPYGGKTVEAASAGEAMAWVQSQVGNSIDYDGAYGAQCVDFIKAYYNYLGVTPVRGNGRDYATNALPSGWTRIQGAQPQKGDILVYLGSSSNPYGHVAIYESDYVTYHQNYGGKQYVTKITNRAYNNMGLPYWGVIRPGFTAPAEVTVQWNLAVEAVQCRNAKIVGTVTASADVAFTRAGAFVWDASGTLVAQADEAVSSYGSYLPNWYDLNEELGAVLNSGTSYTYQFWCEFGSNRYYSPYGGFTTASYDPVGYLENVWVDSGDLYLQGWALDEDDLSEQLLIRVYVGEHCYEITANAQRDDVNQAYPGSTVWHGISEKIPIEETGMQMVTVYAVNTKGGNDTLLAGPMSVLIPGRDAKLVMENGVPYVYDSNGELIRSATPVIGGNKYYVDANGIAQSGWLRLADWQMYFDPETYAAKTGVAKIGDKAYLFDKNGVEILRSRTEVIDGKKYWFQPDGSLMSGWCRLGDWTMYYDPETYVGARGLTVIDGVPYVFDENGVLMRNQTPLIDGKKYFVNGSGIAQSGWLRLADWQMYFDPETYEAAVGITKVDGNAYLFDENGVEILKSRTEVINGKIYWFQPDGSLMSGWCRLGDWTMYFDPETYEAAVGQVTIDGVEYLFDQNGVMQG